MIHLVRTVQRPAEFILVVESVEIVSASPVVSEVGVLPQVLLATTLIREQDGKGKRVVCRAFLDNGSQGSFVTEQCVQKLRHPHQRMNVNIMGLASVGIQQVCSRVNLVFTSLYSEVMYDVPAFVLAKISNPLPQLEVRVDNWIHFEGVQLADLQFFRPGEVDVLLGADIYMHLMSSGCHVLQTGFRW